MTVMIINVHLAASDVDVPPVSETTEVPPRSAKMFVVERFAGYQHALVCARMPSPLTRFMR